jgi:hypothetical protein
MPRPKKKPPPPDGLAGLLGGDLLDGLLPEEFKILHARDADPKALNSSLQVIAELAAKIAERKAEGLNLYEPLPNQAGFFSSMAWERIARGSVRSGKTTCGAVEVARAVTGNDPFGKWPKSDGVFYIVGISELHLADPIHKKLFRAQDNFRMIRDKKTGCWRAFRPWDIEDLEREKDARWAPPLIPPRMIQEFSWISKKDNIPKFCRLKNGWEIHFFSAGAPPRRGVAIDGVWFDEEIPGQAWYPEMSSRLLDKDGRFIWTAAPQSATQELFELHTRAEEQQHLPPAERTCEEFFMTLAANPHISERKKKQLAEKLSPEEQKIRIGGEFAILSYLVYPEFSENVHGIDSFDIPGDWTLYMWLDPGRVVCATAFIAVPPPHHPMHPGKFMFDELYLQQSSAPIWGESVAQKINQLQFEMFGIDHNYGRQHEQSGDNIEEIYNEQLAKHKLYARQGGNRFNWGSDNPKTREEKLRAWLQIQPNGKPIFYYFKDRCRWVKTEFTRFHRKIEPKSMKILDDVMKRNNHLMDDLGMAAVHGCEWVAPKRREDDQPFSQFHAWLNRMDPGPRHDHINLGPGSSRTL